MGVLSFILDPLLFVAGFLLSQIFYLLSSWLYSNKLVYNALWEDPRCDAQALQLKPSDKVLEITSGGCHALEHAAAGVAHVYCIDRNPCQNAVLELKIAAIKELDYDTFWQMFGIGRVDDFTATIYPRLRKYLTPKAAKFWDKNSHYFDGGWFRSTFYFRGCAGVLAWLIKIYFLAVPGLNSAIADLFNAQTVEEQKKIYFGRVQKKLWNPVLKKAVESSASLSWMGVPESQQKLLATADENVGMFMKKSLEYALTELPIRENYHWRVYFFGSYTKECCPEYLKEENFKKLKGGLVNNISFHTCTITEFLQQYPYKDISKFLLLDHQDWLALNVPALTEEWNEILSHCTPDAQILWRSAAKETTFIYDLKVTYKGKEVAIKDITTFDRKLAEKLHKEDRVHTYTSFDICRLTA